MTCANTASTTTMSGRIGAATHAHQPLVAIRSLRLVDVSSGGLASEGYSLSTALLRDVIFEPHTVGPRRAESCRWPGR
jgi:hypothetical protein